MIENNLIKDSKAKSEYLLQKFGKLQFEFLLNLYNLRLYAKINGQTLEIFDPYIIHKSIYLLPKYIEPKTNINQISTSKFICTYKNTLKILTLNFSICTIDFSKNYEIDEDFSKGFMQILPNIALYSVDQNNYKFDFLRSKLYKLPSINHIPQINKTIMISQRFIIQLFDEAKNSAFIFDILDEENGFVKYDKNSELQHNECFKDIFDKIKYYSLNKNDSLSSYEGWISKIWIFSGKSYFLNTFFNKMTIKPTYDPNNSYIIDF